MMLAPLVWMMLAQVPTTPLSGTVVGPDGVPVVGAELVLVGLPSFDPPIVARGKTGEGGRFSLDRPASLAGDHHPQRAPILWVVKPGFRLSATRFPEALPRGDEPVRIVLEPPGKAEVRVEGPDGRPVAGVKVCPERLKTHYTNVHDVVAEMASATTGPDGLAVLDAVSAEELAYVDIHSKEFGIQGRPVTPPKDRPTVISLRSVSTWKGRLSGDDAKLAKGWQVRAYTRAAAISKTEPATTGYVETQTDEEGRFTLAPIAIGSLQLDLKPPGDLPVLADIPSALVVREGREESVEIPLVKATTITGLVLERGTKKPIPGVSVHLTYLGGRRNGGGSNIKTDEQGRYTVQSLPGEVRVGISPFPKTHVAAPGQHWEDFKVAPGSGVIEMATREGLPVARPLRGEVVDEAGKGVPGAIVEARWMLNIGGQGAGGTNQTRADDRGAFSIEGIGPGSNVTVTAKSPGLQTPSPVAALADEDRPLKVSLVHIPTVAVAGRLLGPGGIPLPGVVVKVEFRVQENNFPGFARPAQFANAATIQTGPDGTFLTPKELDRKGSEFRVEVSTEGHAINRTAWVSPGEGDVVTLPDLTLRRLRTIRVVSGTVVDLGGKPILGASVMQAGDGPAWTSAKVDDSGRFRLKGVAGGRALVFAEAPGFRFGGTMIGGGAEPVEIRLARETEPPIATLKTLPPALAREQERALARELLEPVIPLAQAGSLGVENTAVIPILGRVDPDRVMAMIENRTIANPSVALASVALGLYEVDPALVIRTIESDLEPTSRAGDWLTLEGFRPAADRARRENLLDRALADARLSTNPEVKLRLLGQIADRWLGLGSLDRATPILREGRAIEATFPRDRWSQEAEEFANVLAVIDLPAAIALFERQGKTNVSKAEAVIVQRHKNQAAVRLASLNPAEAERLLGRPSDQDYDHPTFVLLAARRMARVDLPRARQLLETIDDEPRGGGLAGPFLIPFGLGRMAAELADSNPAQARGLLDEAFLGLRKLALEGQTGYGAQTIAALMAELLPTVERLQPDRLSERIWLAAASRPPSVEELKADNIQGMVVLAMLAGRYDRAVADEIVAPALERLPDLLAENAGGYAQSDATFKALAIYDPRGIVPLIRSLPEAARKAPARRDNFNAASAETKIRLAAAEILGLPFEVRSREAGPPGNYAWLGRLGD